MRETTKVLQELRDKGVTLVKAENDPVTNTVTLLNRWLIGFCGEQTVYGIKMILSVSRTDLKKFKTEELLKELPELQEVFDIHPAFSFTKKIQFRGHTLCFRASSAYTSFY